MKKIIVIILIVLASLGIGITYSMYTTDAKMKTDIALAAFVFDTDRKELINIPISNLKPGDDVKYEFSISNNSNKKKSDVSIKYNIIIKTMHLMPLEISLYDSEDNLVMNCNEDNKRNELNELECHSNDIIMPYKENVKDEYYIEIKFPIEYNSIEYSSLIDYINLEINSTQKID